MYKIRRKKAKKAFDLNKIQLDSYSTAVGAIGGIAAILGQFEFIPERWGNMLFAVSGVIVSWMVQKPATSAPTTEDMEEDKNA